MSRAEALAWQAGCVAGAALGVFLVELYAEPIEALAVRLRAAWRVWQAG